MPQCSLFSPLTFTYSKIKVSSYFHFKIHIFGRKKSLEEVIVGEKKTNIENDFHDNPPPKKQGVANGKNNKAKNLFEKLVI